MDAEVINVFIFVVNVLMSFYRNQEGSRAEEQNSQELGTGDRIGGPEEDNNNNNR